MAEEKDEALPITPVKTVSDDDLRVSRSGPAIYANRVIVMNEQVVRIAFVEQTKDGPLFRVAVALPHQIAIDLANVLKGLLAELEGDFEKFKAETLAKAQAEVGKKDG